MCQGKSENKLAGRERIELPLFDLEAKRLPLSYQPVVVDDGLEPSRRTNQVLGVYKAPLRSRAIDNYFLDAAADFAVALIFAFALASIKPSIPAAAPIAQAKNKLPWSV